MHLTLVQTSVMFDALVVPVMLYGCEIWAMIVEAGRTPISHRVTEKIAAYRSRLQGMAQPRLLANAASENFGWQNEGKPRDAKCWCAMAHKLITKESAGQEHMDVARLKGWLASKGDAVLREAMIDGNMDRRELYGTQEYSHAKGDRRRTYARWFWPGIRATQTILNMNLRKRLMRFRLGAHDLQVVTGAWAEGIRLPREQRICRCCMLNKVEDETHLIFECPHYSIIRMGYEDDIFCLEGADRLVCGICPVLSESDVMMRKFFGQANQAQVAQFIQCCLRERKSKLKELKAAAVAQD